MDVQQPARGGVVRAQLLLSLRKHRVHHGGRRISAEHFQNVRCGATERTEGTFKELAARLLLIRRERLAGCTCVCMPCLLEENRNRNNDDRNRNSQRKGNETSSRSIEEPMQSRGMQEGL